MDKSVFTLKGFILSLFTLSFGHFANAADMNVIGKNNINRDRQAIQNAINNARSGDTIYLIGTFQLDGQAIYISKSNIKLVGQGASSGWKTMIKGVVSMSPGAMTYSTLRPASDNADGSIYNNAFFIGAPNGGVTVSNVTIQGIEFQSHNRAITLSADMVFNNIYFPNAPTLTGASASHIMIQDNWFDNNDQDIEFISNNNNVTIRNNLMTNNFNTDIIGNTSFLGASANSSSPTLLFYPIGIASNFTISGNVIKDTNTNNNDFGLVFYGEVDNVNIQNNTFLMGGNFGDALLFLGGKNITVQSNHIDGGGANAPGGPTGGIYASIDWGTSPIPSENNVAINNIITNALPGIFVDSGTSGWTFKENNITGSVPGYAPYGVPSLGDAFFCDDTTTTPGGICDYEYLSGEDTFPPSYSHNNLLISNNYCIAVLNLGINNTLQGKIELSTNIANPPALPPQCSAFY